MNSQGCGCGDFDGPQVLSTPARNNYFYGKLLDEQHFKMEQRYFNMKRWMLNRLAVGGGVLCGLQMIVGTDGSLTMAPGVAIDWLGREIFVPVATVIDPWQLTDSCGKQTGAAAAGPVTVRLAYHPCPAEPMPVLVPDCESTARCAPGTIRESFAVLVTQGAPPAPAPAWPPTTFFQPPSGQPRVKAADLMADVVEWVDKANPQAPTPANAPVLLAQVTIPTDTKTLLTAASVTDFGQPILLSQATLFQMILALWERVEQCCAAGGGEDPRRLDGPGSTSNPGAA